ncbi:MAG: DUF4825 domain-containing protein [Defluviitaleaceae bacterium]|nr:DUF4825 domain-containing protein [Defluviitaleaceae bacterium]
MKLLLMLLMMLVVPAGCARYTAPAGYPALATPYVGNAPAVSRIVLSLPPPGDGWRQQFISIDSEAYSLTVYYEPLAADTVPQTPDLPADTFEAHAALLFELIGNLAEVTFAKRQTPSDGILDTEAYKHLWIATRN